MANKTIAIIEKNRAAIEAALASVNGKAQAHTYTSYAEIAGMAETAEAALSAINLPKASRAGAVWKEISGAEVAKSYRNPRQATSVRLIRRSAGWHIVTAKAVTIWQEGGGKGSLYITEAQAEEAKSRFADGLNVQ